MKYIIYFAILVFCSTSSHSQTDKYLDSIFKDALVLKGRDLEFQKAEQKFWEVYRGAHETKNTKMQCKALLQIAMVNRSDLKKALQSVKEAEKIAFKNKHSFSIICVDIFKASLFSRIGMYEQSQITFAEAIAKIPNIPEKENVTICSYLTCYYYRTEGLFVEKAPPSQVLQYAKLTLKYGKLDGTKPVLLKCYAQMAKAFIVNKNIDSALFYTNLGEADRVERSNILATGLNRAAIYKYQNNYAAAAKHYLTVLPLLKKIDDKQLLAETYENLAEIYRKLNLIAPATFYEKQYLETQATVTKQEEEAFDYFTSTLRDESKDDAVNNNVPKNLARIFAIAVLVLAILFVHNSIKSKKEFQSFKNAILKLEERKEEESKNPLTKEEVALVNYESNLVKDKMATLDVVWQSKDLKYLAKEEEICEMGVEAVYKMRSDISEDMENFILTKLEKFERLKKFRKRDTTLYNMAESFETNKTYLSEVIKKHRNKSFNNYLNDLRIFYIIEEMQKGEAMTSLKISALVLEAGFTTYSNFYHVFKQHTAMSPTKFVEYMKSNTELVMNE